MRRWEFLVGNVEKFTLLEHSLLINPRYINHGYSVHVGMDLKKAGYILMLLTMMSSRAM